MIKNYRCPKCQNLFSQKDYYLHNNYCKVPSHQSKTQVNGTNRNIINNSNYSNNYNRNNNVKRNNHTVYVSKQNENKNKDLNKNQNLNTNKNIIISQQGQPKAQTQIYTQSFRPLTATYFNQNQNQSYNYSQLNQNPINNYPNSNNTNSIYNCNICGKTIPIKDKNDHLLSHKLEQEEKDRLHAQRLQDEDLFENLSPEQIQEQREIEEHIKRQNNQIQNQNHRNQNHFNNNNNNFIRNNFNDDEDEDEFDLRMNDSDDDNFGRINMNRIPNIIIRRANTTNNNGIHNLGMDIGSPNFFDNIFNRNMHFNHHHFMNNPTSGPIRRIIIPMGGMGNMEGMRQNELNEMIERMLHHTRDNPTDAAIVSELPENKIDDINKLDNDKKNCVICMEDFKKGDKSTNLPCLHMFHTNCIQSWLKKQNTCPICKFKLTEDNINNINRRG